MRPLVIVELAELERIRAERKSAREYMERVLKWLTLGTARPEDRIQEAVKLLQEAVTLLR